MRFLGKNLQNKTYERSSRFSSVPKVIMDDLVRPKNNSVRADPEWLGVSCGEQRLLVGDRAWSAALKGY